MLKTKDNLSMNSISVRKQSGFTLIELIVTLTVLMIVASVAIVAWPGDVINMRALSESLAADIRYTQTLSMATRERYRINLTSSTQYQILNGSGTAILIPSVNSTAVTLPNGITLSSSINYLVFDDRGIPYGSTTSDGNGTALSSALTITLTGTQTNKQVTVAPETGRVYIP